MRLENDITFFKVFITDTCDDLVLTRIYVNDSKIPHTITTSFYLPLVERRRIMIAGTGEKCLVSKFVAKNIDLKTFRKNGGNNTNNTNNTNSENREDRDEKIGDENYFTFNVFPFENKSHGKRDCCNIY